MKKTYYVIWTYVANYSNILEVDAEDAEDAVAKVISWYGPEFGEKARVFTFDKPPSSTYQRGQFWKEL